MWVACSNGHFDVCKWLYEAGAKDDVTKESRCGTNMWAACRNGNLHICKWLWKVGAAADITKPNWAGTPMYVACDLGHLSVSKWLIVNGALNTPEAAGHVDAASVKRDITRCLHKIGFKSTGTEDRVKTGSGG